MKIGRMRERIVIQKNTVVIDAIGNHRNDWVDYFACYTYPSTYNVDERTEEVTTENRSVTFSVRYSSETAVIDSTHYRVLHRGQIYNIKAVDFMNFDHKEVRIRAVLEVRPNVK